MIKSRAMDDESKSCNRLCNRLMFFFVALSSHALAMNDTVFPPTPSQEKNIRSLGSYFFRNSTSRKPNSEVDLHFFSFLFFFIFPKRLGFERIASAVRSALSIGESGEDLAAESGYGF